MFLCQWHDMLNFFDMNELQPNDNNDMMQCVTCNRSSLFAPRLKILEKRKEKTNIFVKQTRIFSNVLEVWDINSFRYEIEIRKDTNIANYIVPFHSKQNNNWIKIQLKWNLMHIGGESIENLLMNMVLEK